VSLRGASRRSNLDARADDRSHPFGSDHWRLEERSMEIAATIERIKAAVGPRGWIADPRDQEPYLVEARGLYRGATRLGVRPASTAEAAAVVRICAEAKLSIVPQGGNTGLVGGEVPPRGRE
jgi:hypothetical protein